MPIEIRELIIKASIDNQESSDDIAATSTGDTDTNQEHLVSICVEKVLEILKDKQER